ncbi:MAG: ABC transporter ATP-binding protein [Bradymonadia bacterium]
MLEVDNLLKRYGDHAAVSGLTVRVEPGTILGLVGPNGAGKTTALRMICGVIPADGGQIKVAGHAMSRRGRLARQHLGFVPAEPALLDDLTVEEHLRFIGRLYGVEDVPSHAHALLTDMQLVDHRRALPEALSRGMQQKLMLACALLHRPAVLVLDEPFTGLDPEAIRRLRERIRRAADEGASVVISSHLLGLVEQLADRLLLLSRGRKIAEGTLAELTARKAEGQRDLESLFFELTGRAG